MATEFKILRGKKTSLFDNQGNCRITDKLVDGYWYLTNDTAEVYVALTINGILQLKKINECDINNDFSDLDSFDERLTLLEQEEKLHTYGYRKDFPGTGLEGHLYVAVDEQKTYVWYNAEYLIVGGMSDVGYVEPTVIYGGSAD